MADTTLIAPATKTQAITNANLGVGNRFIVRGARRISVSIDDTTIGFWVTLVAAGHASSSDAYAEHVPAGGTYWQDVSQGQQWYLDVRSDSGTPTASIAVG